MSEMFVMILMNSDSRIVVGALKKEAKAKRRANQKDTKNPMDKMKHLMEHDIFLGNNEKW